MTVIASSRPIAFDGERKSQMETARFRLMLIAMLMFLSFGVLGYRTLDIGMSSGVVRRAAPEIAVAPIALARADILDRNGEVLATNLETFSLYADTRKIKHPEKVAASACGAGKKSTGAHTQPRRSKYRPPGASQKQGGRPESL